MSVVERIDKPWGYELVWARTAAYAAKILHINKGHQLSLQYHEEKEESIYLASGRMILLLEDERGELQKIQVGAGEPHHIPTGRRHRMIALEDCEVFEVSTPQLEDVVRIEDRYGRADASRR
jgi:mannose-6-phosphate isomerase